MLSISFMDYGMERGARELCRFTALLNEVVESAMILFPEVRYADLWVPAFEFQGYDVQ
jgi:hypothetical protein